MSYRCQDHRHIEFSKALGCDAELVEEVFLQIGVDDVPNRQEVRDLTLSLKSYVKAEKKLREAVIALESLPELQKATHQIMNADLVPQVNKVLESIRNWKVSTEQKKAKAKSVGPSNESADRLAEFVAALFACLEKEVTFGVQADTTDPSTSFGKMVKRALEIYRVRHPFKFEQAYVPRADGLKDTINLPSGGELIDWRRPAERAWRKHKKRMPFQS